jgi:hypothetical protein
MLIRMFNVNQYPLLFEIIHDVRVGARYCRSCSSRSMNMELLVNFVEVPEHDYDNWFYSKMAPQV